MHKKRILSGAIDYYLINIISIVLGWIIYIVQEADIFNDDLYLKITVVVYLVVVICMLLLKDAIRGRSIGKKLCKLKILYANGETANKVQLILRNITLLIWPIELILFIVIKNRLGDILSRTVVVNE